MDEVEKRKDVVIKSKHSLIGDLNFFGGESDKHGILANLNELSRMKQDE